MMGEKAENRRWVFEEAPVAQAVFTMAIPTVITQLINIVYNFADAWYVGRTGPGRSAGRTPRERAGSSRSACTAG